MSRAWAGGSTREHRRWRLAVLTRDAWICQVQLVCDGDRATEADHIVPLSRGGARFDLANGRGSCKPCNGARGGQQGAAALARTAVRTWTW